MIWFYRNLRKQAVNIHFQISSKLYDLCRTLASMTQERKIKGIKTLLLRNHLADLVESFRGHCQHPLSYSLRTDPFRTLAAMALEINTHMHKNCLLFFWWADFAKTSLHRKSSQHPLKFVKTFKRFAPCSNLAFMALVRKNKNFLLRIPSGDLNDVHWLIV